MSAPLFSLRRLLVGDEVEHARTWQERVVRAAAADEAEEHRRFVGEMRSEPGEGRVMLGRVRDREGPPFWVGMPGHALLGRHAWVTGATGSGKSFFALSVLLQVLAAGRHPVLIVDMKGELAALLLDTVVPALCHTAAGEALLPHLRVVRPFDPAFVPQLRITLPEPGVPAEVQAYTLAAALEEALADDLGSRMHRTFLKAALLAVRLNAPLTEIVRWLQDPVAFLRAARRAGDPSVLDYATTVFPRENPTTIQALCARLDTFLFLEGTRLALSTPGCVSFGDALERGLTVVDVGDPPAGAERLARFWAGILVGRLTRAILSRPVVANSPQTLVMFEEFQEGLGRDQVEQFGRLLALARYKRVSLWFINQQLAQVAAIDPTLLRLLQTNVGIEAVFRCSYEDAVRFSHALPVPAGEKHPAEARARLVQSMTQLPTRAYYLHLREAAFRAKLVRSPRLALDDLRALARSLPEDVRACLRQGTVALPRADAAPAVRRRERDHEAECEVEHPVLRPAPARPGDDGLPHLG